MSLYKQFKTNEDVERTGVVLQYGESSTGKPVEIRIARAGGANTQYGKRLEALVKPYRRQLQTDTADENVIKRVMRQVYAETVVLGWENVEFPVLDADGNATGEFESRPFSVANCIQLFTDLPDLFLDVQEQANKSALFRMTILESEAKN